MTTPISFVVPCLPPSYNSHFHINYSLHECYLTKEAQEFKRLVKMNMPASQWPDNPYFILLVCYHNEWYYKNGKPKKQDLGNLDKLLIDAIMEHIGWDDSRVWIFQHWKVQDCKEVKTVCYLDTIDISTNN